jgi:hypothetical protein
MPATVSTCCGLTRGPAPRDERRVEDGEEDDDELGADGEENIHRTARKPTSRRRASWGMLSVVDAGEASGAVEELIVCRTMWVGRGDCGLH